MKTVFSCCSCCCCCYCFLRVCTIDNFISFDTILLCLLLSGHSVTHHEEKKINETTQPLEEFLKLGIDVGGDDDNEENA